MRRIAVALFIAAAMGMLLALFVGAVSAFLFYVHLTADGFSVGPLGWFLNAAVWITPLLFAAAALVAFKAVRLPQQRGIILALGLSAVAVLILFAWVRFDPLLEIDSCLDAGGAWRDGGCVR